MRYAECQPEGDSIPDIQCRAYKRAEAIFGAVFFGIQENKQVPV
jgi:hypothetical protein